MALGFEKMFTGSLKTFFDDRENPLKDFFQKDTEMRGHSKGPFAPKLFGNAGRESTWRNTGQKQSILVKLPGKIISIA